MQDDKTHDKTTSEASNERAASDERRPIGLTGNRAEAPLGYSPPPWRTGRKVHRTIYCEEHSTEGRLIGVMDRREDATLAAAAPKMYAALASVAEWLEETHAQAEWEDEGAQAELVSIRAALAKAEGREP